MKTDWALLNHMRDCIELIESYIGDADEPLADSRTRDAVLHNLQVIAQSSIQLSEELKARQMAVGWQQLKAFRNVLVHEYFTVDAEQVSLALNNSLPVLKQAVLAEIDHLKQQDCAGDKP